MLPLLLACTPDPTPDTFPEPTFRWVQSLDEDTWENAQVGIWWSLTHLNILPTETTLRLIQEQPDDVHFQFAPEIYALPALKPLFAQIAESDPSDSYDIGRFLLQTLYDPWVYYDQTDTCQHLDTWQRLHLQDPVEHYNVTTSLLVEGERSIFLTRATSAEGIAYLAQEGEGSLQEGTFQILESETIDILPTGQQHFAVYDAEGQLRPVAEASPAGQPGRCMWCHEGNIQRGTPTNVSPSGYLSTEDFLAEIAAQQALLMSYRTTLQTPLQFEDPKAHTYGEWLGELFLHPTLSRVAREWNRSEADVLEILGDPQETHPEWPKFGMLYSRAEVDAAAADQGMTVLPTFSSARELSPEDPMLAGGPRGDCGE